MRFATDQCGRQVIDTGMGFAPTTAPTEPALGNCFTGSCASALAPYGWSSPPCGMPPLQQVAWQIAQRIVSGARRHGIFAR